MLTDPALTEALESCLADRDAGRSPTEAGFDALLERWPGHPGALEAVGEAYDEAGDTGKAIASYQGALAGLEGTELRRCYLRLGDALRRIDRPQDAVELLEAGLDEFPGSRSLRTFLALALSDLGRADAALALVLEVLVDPLPSPDLELFRPTVRQRAKQLLARSRAA